MPSLDVEASYESNPHVAGLMAVHLVSQILDEAYVIANAADESGQPWRYLSMLKNLRSGRLGDVDDDISFVASQGDSDGMAEGKEHCANVVATSTPQKISGSPSSKNKPENSLIGQGDEEYDSRHDDLTNSTSMFINHLFDMSEVERVIICDDTEIMQSDSMPNELLTQAMTKIMESYVNNAFNIAFAQEPQIYETIVIDDTERNTEQYQYSFLADAFGGEVGKDIAFYIDDDGTSSNVDKVQVLEIEQEVIPVNEKIENQDDAESNDRVGKNDVAFYENAYMTLNRDYDQCSDDEGDPVLQDPKGMNLQEIELLTANTSDDELSTHREPLTEERKELAAISAVSGASGSRKSKSSLISRCRTQGARLLACLRGWWRRKTPGKRREIRSRQVRGMCPLSPDARRRASSLLDQRDLYSSKWSRRSVVWKFNTVNETLVNSSRWKDYTFEVKPDECGEF